MNQSLDKGGIVSSISDFAVSIQTSSQTVPSTPSWLGEVTVMAHSLKRLGALTAIENQVRFARRRFGHYEVIDFVAVLLGYAISGEPTLQAFYERIQPFAPAFMALFGRNRLPARSTLSRFLAALNQAPVEALRELFLEDLCSHPLTEEEPGGLWDRQESHWLVFDVDGTRQAARQRALPQTTDRPPAQRRLREVCAPGYLGRKRGEIVRTRTTVLQAHTHQFLGTFAGAGNGDYRGELLRSLQVLLDYGRQVGIPAQQIVIRLDGLYGNAVPLSDVLAAGLRWASRAGQATARGGPTLDEAVVPLVEGSCRVGPPLAAGLRWASRAGQASRQGWPYSTTGTRGACGAPAFILYTTLLSGSSSTWIFSAPGVPGSASMPVTSQWEAWP